MIHKPWIACTIAVTIGLASACRVPASAQTVAGDRVFLSTPGVGEPGVADQVNFSALNGAGGARDTGVVANFSKRLTDDWGIVVTPGWTHLTPGGDGFQNLQTTLKYVPVIDEAHEFILCLGLAVDWGGSGAARVGADPNSTITPQVYFGKGFDDAPEGFSWLKPLSVTGQFGLGLPVQSRTTATGRTAFGGAPISIDTLDPTVFDWGLTFQYNTPLANNDIAPGSASAVFANLTPLVELAVQSPIDNIPSGAGRSTGTINPGLAYVAKPFQLVVEAVVPLNGASGRHVGALVALNFSLSEIFPDGIGQPLFR